MIYHMDIRLTEEEIATIIHALNYYAYNAPHINEEIYDYAMSAAEKVMDSAQYADKE